MKLVGITPATGTNALAIAINYGNNIPQIRVNSSNRGNLDFNSLPDYDNVVVLGHEKSNPIGGFHLLAQINNGSGGITQAKQGASLPIQPCKLEEQKEPPSFSAYIERLSI